MPRNKLAIALTAVAIVSYSSLAEANESRVEGPSLAPVSAAPLDSEHSPVDRTARRQIEAGKWTMVSGAAGIGLGGILVGTGLGLIDKCMDDFFSDDESALCDHGSRTLGAGGLIAAGSALTLVAGGIIYGAGKRKQRRALLGGTQARVRVSPRVSFSAGTVTSGLTLRF